MKHFSVAVIAVALTLTSTVTAQNKQPQDTTKAEKLNEIVLKATRVTKDNPVTFSNVTKEDLKSRNLGQDLPILLSYLPNVVTTSDAGAGIGYTGIRVRGSDATRVNVTLNGVPYNDSESQGTFWVNLPDFASSVESLQLQRGVGTSTNGSGAFGASLNIKTTDYSEEAQVAVSNSIGSFNSRKHSIQFTTGLLDDRWEFNGRASQVYSDGFIDRADSNLKSYYISGAYVGDKTLIKATIFGGQERTYQAYYGVDLETLKTNRTANFAGFYIDAAGNEKFYNDQVDNYNQDHYQLLLSHRFNNNWSASATVHYTKGRGYFQELQDDARLTRYNLPTFTNNGQLVERSDLETRRWLDNEFYGIVSNLNYKNSVVDASFGLAANQYDGLHYGEVLAGEFIQLPERSFRYYSNVSDKQEYNAFAKANFTITEKLSLFADLQMRLISYETLGPDSKIANFVTDEDYAFFNPKAGAVYNVNASNRIYASIARAQREPSRSDFKDGTPEPEDLLDYELGYRISKPDFNININGYFMDYKNQLVLTGAIDDNGTPLRTNSGDSYRLGLEIDAQFRVTDKIFLQPNFAVSRNQNQDFINDENGTPTNIGDTEIAYSPSIVAGNALTYKFNEGFEVSLLSKYVGSQQLDNTENAISQLEGYFVSDFNAQYIWTPKNLVKEVAFSVLVNNILDEEYSSNGYAFPGSVFVFPQARINFLTGVTVTF
ncbi:TonB-dependent receptor [Nonlabens antarcticus]|uniref:TonB-dependent receptor n=1 Tax=Nonlabens antarcticus TaxID=392714 RepID=UPI0018912ECD|nr:TonB-dependent receptor [Nonlabens antarcticus]